MYEGETETELNTAMLERASGVGLVMRRPRWNPNTELVDEATAYAKEKGLGGQFHHVAASAYWETGADLSNLETLKELAEKSGMNWEELSPLLSSRSYRDRILKEYEAATAEGVVGSPTYMIGGEFLRGDVSLEDLQSAVTQASGG